MTIEMVEFPINNGDFQRIKMLLPNPNVHERHSLLSYPAILVG